MNKCKKEDNNDLRQLVAFFGLFLCVFIYYCVIVVFVCFFFFSCSLSFVYLFFVSYYNVVVGIILYSSLVNSDGMVEVLFSLDDFKQIIIIMMMMMMSFNYKIVIELIFIFCVFILLSVGFCYCNFSSSSCGDIVIH